MHNSKAKSPKPKSGTEVITSDQTQYNLNKSNYFMSPILYLDALIKAKP